MLWRVDLRSRLLPFNRTSMELKHITPIGAVYAREFTFNRTSMELKHAFTNVKPRGCAVTFNRTSMELKPLEVSTSHLVLKVF